MRGRRGADAMRALLERAVPLPRFEVERALERGDTATTDGRDRVLEEAAAAIQPLPGAPPAQGHVETDVENLVIYQTALATHAKRDEQLRTLGSLLGKLLK